jgi:hypothetical protein
MNKLSKNQVFIIAHQFLLSNDLSQLCEVMSVDINKIKLLSMQPNYKEFLVPKGNQKFRIIEAPQKELMQMHREFNLYLQAAYYIHQTPAAYGFIISVRGETKTKNIYENAKCHLGHKYMLKIDLKDFFHQITKQRLYYIFKQKPFHYSNNTAQILSNLFTYKGRLPMGAPTSPALSNFATVQLDNDLIKWSNKYHITYTRFADDMTFSTNAERFTHSHLDDIAEICKTNNYELQTGKTIFYNENDIKEVTGLILRDTVDIHDEFYKELNEDLTRLRILMETTVILKNTAHSETLRKFKQEIKGKINFIGMIEGYHSKIYYRYSQKIKEALNPDNEKLFNRWIHFNYF